MSKKSQLLSEYRKQRRRIQQNIRRMKKRGYIVPEKALPKKPKKITEASINRLKKVTPEELYKKSKAKTETGKIITGTEKRKQERQDKARRAAVTRRANEARRKKWLEDVNKAPSPEKIDLEDLYPDTGITPEDEEEYPYEGEIIYKQIKDMIAEAGRNHKRAADHLDSVLEGEISEFGYNAVMESLSQAPEEMLMLADRAIQYDVGSEQHESAISVMLGLIKGSIPTAEELSRLQDFLDDDTDFDPRSVLLED